MAGFGSCSVKAQTTTSGPLVSPNLIGAPYSTPTGTTPYTGTGGGYSGGVGCRFTDQAPAAALAQATQGRFLAASPITP